MRQQQHGKGLRVVLSIASSPVELQVLSFETCEAQFSVESTGTAAITTKDITISTILKPVQFFDAYVFAYVQLFLNHSKWIRGTASYNLQLAFF